MAYLFNVAAHWLAQAYGFRQCRGIFFALFQQKAQKGQRSENQQKSQKHDDCFNQFQFIHFLLYAKANTGCKIANFLYVGFS